jgi:hypothetical protein
MAVDRPRFYAQQGIHSPLLLSIRLIPDVCGPADKDAPASPELSFTPLLLVETLQQCCLQSGRDCLAMLSALAIMAPDRCDPTTCSRDLNLSRLFDRIRLRPDTARPLSRQRKQMRNVRRPGYWSPNRDVHQSFPPREQTQGQDPIRSGPVPQGR